MKNCSGIFLDDLFNGGNFQTITFESSAYVFMVSSVIEFKSAMLFQNQDEKFGLKVLYMLSYIGTKLD